MRSTWLATSPSFASKRRGRARRLGRETTLRGSFVLIGVSSPSITGVALRRDGDGGGVIGSAIVTAATSLEA